MADDLTVPEVEIDLSGENFILKPTLGAAIGINAAFGGIFPAGQRAMAGDIVAIATIIRHGAALDAKAERELVEKVFRAGAPEVSASAMRFIAILMNGGRAEKKEAEPGEAEPSGPAQS